jgi:hypothetical protein
LNPVDALVVILAAASYACFYAADPGRQRPAPPRRRASLLRLAGGVVAAGSLILAGVTVGWGVGLVLWASAALTAGTLLVVGWPWVDPAGGDSGGPGASADRPTRPGAEAGS